MPFDTPDESIPVLVFSFLIGILSIVGNGIIIYITLRYKKFRSSVCNCLIGLLAFSEFFDGLAILTSYSYTIYKETNNIKVFDRLTCIGFSICGIFAAVSGQLTMLFMAIDRFMAINKPVKYFQSRSKVSFEGDPKILF